ncbi:MAG: DivIVA domain-containing protein [Bacteroidota bacterium]
MKITPLEIRQKDFEKKLRGYDKDEVNAFLQSLSNEWERMLEESKDTNLKLQQAEREVKKLREVESSLYKTLKTAEDTGANVIEQANKAAELHMKETQMNAEALLTESKNKARAMIEQAEMEARHILEELQDAVQQIQENHREIENQRSIALQELKNLSVALMEKVELSSRDTKEVRLEDYAKRVKKLARESDERIKAEKTDVIPSPIAKEEHEIKSQAEALPFKQEEKFGKPKVQAEPQKAEQVTKSAPDPRDIAKESSAVPTKNLISESKVVAKEATKEREAKSLVSIEIESDQANDTSEVMEKKGPRIARTVSFFDEIDTAG